LKKKELNLNFKNKNVLNNYLINNFYITIEEAKKKLNLDFKTTKKDFILKKIFSLCESELDCFKDYIFFKNSILLTEEEKKNYLKILKKTNF
jgi:hypothetical protein